MACWIFRLDFRLGLKATYRPSCRAAALSGRLKDAGAHVLKGITEGLYASYRDSALRPQLITIDTEIAGSGRAAYLAALESGADFVVGPLTKERVDELHAIETLPIPILALNRGSTAGVNSTTSKRRLLSPASRQKTRQFSLQP